MIYLNTVIQGKTSHIIQFFGTGKKIMSFEVVSVFKVLNGVIRGHCNTFNTWLKSATPNFEFQGFVNSRVLSKFTGGFTKGIFGFSTCRGRNRNKAV